MNNVMTATKAKNNFGWVMDEVLKGKSITIVRNNKPVATVSPIETTYEDALEEESLTLSDSEYEKIKEGMEEFRKTFKFSY